MDCLTNVSDGDIVNRSADIAISPLSYYRYRDNFSKSGRLSTTRFTHAILLDQACAHCPRFPNAASRGSSGRVSVPVWLIIRKDHLSIISLVILHSTNCLILSRLIKERFLLKPEK
ncbi:hypothetical protein C5167_020759 [Papaver somniferum]|uniref:Uncharacterized protein n=1 Tax=Papaver somniferum TaxID=3469 RepID=A0A4Y7ITW4_PAPSO|nr:hypothetical protein C5167_020759 [Papaver somniferum]